MRHGMTAMALVFLATGCSSAHAPGAKSVGAEPAPRAPVSSPADAEKGVPAPAEAAPSGPRFGRVEAEHEGAKDVAEEALAEAIVEAPKVGEEGVAHPAPPAKSAPSELGGRPHPVASAAKRMPGGAPDDEDGRGGARATAPRLARDGASVRAGEWDDNANYREFQKYLAAEKHLPFEKLDVSHRRFVAVRDANGKGVLNCRVIVRDEAQHEAVLTTTAAGRALLFPHASGLDGRALTASTDCEGHAVSARFELSEEDDVVELRLPAARAPFSRTIDLAFILDTTGSMAEEIDAVKDTIAKVASEAARGQTSVRVALVEYKDRGDSFVTRVHPFSDDLADVSRRIATIEASGGGDTPEHANEGLRVALDALAWSSTSGARLAFLIGDAPPHLDYQGDVGYGPSLKRAAARGIQLYTVAASGMDALGQAVWRQLAHYTGGTNLFVLRGGAGPQSTGAGDPKASCGGTQSNYTSANLDQLILAKLALTERLMDADPLRIAGLGRDENAKPCDARLVLAH